MKHKINPVCVQYHNTRESSIWWTDKLNQYKKIHKKICMRAKYLYA